jgi:radical SAM protein with 4Fe4S-binding SPASM domain
MAVSTKKRWDKFYPDKNPFEVAQEFSKRVRALCQEDAPKTAKKVKYLWLYVSETGINDSSGQAASFSKDDWLGVIDETAAQGVEHIIISMGAPLTEHPEVVDISKWAQDCYDILVGIHIYRAPLTQEGAVLLQALDKDKTALFIDPDCAACEEIAKVSGIRIFSGLGQDQETVHPECHLPEEMTCVAANGSMYTCGLVLGENEFAFGHYYDRKLNDVMSDDNLPHTIPEGTPKKGQMCNGCPPLMLKRMRNGHADPDEGGCH